MNDELEYTIRFPKGIPPRLIDDVGDSYQAEHGSRLKPWVLKDAQDQVVADCKWSWVESLSCAGVAFEIEMITGSPAALLRAACIVAKHKPHTHTIWKAQPHHE